jgi:hypothetical protein
MEPQQLTQPNYQPGNLPNSAPGGVEGAPNLPPTPEAPIQSPERSGSPEQLAVDHQTGTPVLPTDQQSTVPQPVVNDAATDDQAKDAAVLATTPTAAADNDTIEKEWIEKVKKVISGTADDPHKQQKYASQLMANYILKRYGRKIGEAEE